MKTKTTIKNIKNYFGKIYQAGYCDLHYIFNHQEPQYYNAGTYGWNCDIYCDYGKDIAITTGYRNMTGKRISKELIEKYTENAKKILNSHCNWEEMNELLEENKENFLNELLNS